MKDVNDIKRLAFDYLKSALQSSYNKKFLKKYKGIAEKLSSVTVDDIEVLPEIKAYQLSSVSMVKFLAKIYARPKSTDGSYVRENLIDEYEYTEIGISPSIISKEKMDLLSVRIVNRIFDSKLLYMSFTKDDPGFLHLCDEKIAKEYKLRHMDLYYQGVEVRASAYDCEVKSSVYSNSLGIKPVVARIKGERGQELCFVIDVYDESKDALLGSVNFFELSDYTKPIIFERILPENAKMFPDMTFIPDYEFCTWKKGFLSYKLVEPQR